MEFLAHFYVIVSSLMFTAQLMFLAVLWLLDVYVQMKSPKTPTDIVDRHFETIIRQ
jgi:hypothetical protein